MTINLNNYEEYLLSYVDGELAGAESKELMQFLQDHPELQEELKLLQATKLQPEEGWVFRDKSVLYHRSDENKLIPLYRKWWLAAAAAAVVLAFIGISFLHRPVQPKNNAEVAIHHPKATDTPVMAPPSKEKTTAGEKQQERLASATAKHEKSLQVTGQSKITSIHRRDLLAMDKNKLATHKNKTVIPGQVTGPANNKEAMTQNLAVNNPAISKQQNNDAPDGNPVVANKLPGTEKAASPIPAIAGNGSSKTGEEINSQPDRPEHLEGTTRPLLAKVNGMAAEKTDRILEESAKLAVAKGKLDEKITDKIGDAQNFVAKKFQSIRKKGIRIGRLEIVMN